MSDLTATNCGCGCAETNGGSCCNTLIWLLLLSCFCGNGNNSCGGGCGFGGDNCLWLILLLCCCGGNNGGIFGGNGCGC